MLETISKPEQKGTIIFGISQNPYAAKITRELSPQEGSTTKNKHWYITK